MTAYTTTRGADPVDLQSAVLRGLGADGGLFVPARLPALGEGVPAPAGVSGDMRALAAWVAPALFPTLPTGHAGAVARDALDFPIPLIEVERDRWVLELFHGPSHAFKDVGARFMARLFAEFPGDRVRTVLVATSGDTGGAVARAFHGLEGTRVVVLFPRDGISVRQRKQMTTLRGNVVAVAVAGTFDDCQRLVKSAFAHTELSDEHGLTSANSINVARLLPQAIYYVHAANELGAFSDPSRSPWFVVPSGNLGNLCAGVLAQRAGTPVSGFTAATNSNRVFADFLAGDPYQPRASTPTLSNAMDVGAPSNLERLLWLAGSDGALRRAVRGVTIDDERTVETIRRVHDETGYILDPHTAVAYAASSAQDEAVTHHPVVVLATAHPAKFPEVVEAAIGREVPVPPGLAHIQDRVEHMLEIEPDLSALRRALDEVAE